MGNLLEQAHQLCIRYNLDWEQLRSRWNEPFRFFHTEQHLLDVLNILRNYEKSVSQRDYDILRIAALYHDAIYEPGAQNNEERSANLFLHEYNGSDKSFAATVAEIILASQLHKADADSLAELFCNADMDIVRRDFGQLLEWEHNVFREFQRFPYSEYRLGRLKFLDEAIQSYPENKENLFALKQYVQSRRPNIGIYPGSFNPFHLGHLNVLEKAERIFEKVIVAQGVNPEKFEVGALLKEYSALRHRQTEQYNGLLTDIVSQHEEYANVGIVRGLRNGDDLDYEVNQLRFMEDLKGQVNIVFILCDKQYEHISSSALKNLEKIRTGLAQIYIPE